MVVNSASYTEANLQQHQIKKRVGTKRRLDEKC